jgi:hypothetical protein
MTLLNFEGYQEKLKRENQDLAHEVVAHYLKRLMKTVPECLIPVGLRKLMMALLVDVFDGEFCKGKRKKKKKKKGENCNHLLC